MNLALFSETPVRDFYDSAVTHFAERRVFDITDDVLRSTPSVQLIDNILTVLSPGRLVLDPVINEEMNSESGQSLLVRRWLEYCGSVRLLTLRPRQYYATPPYVSVLQPPAAGRPGRIVLEQRVRGTADEPLFDEFCSTEFGKIRDYCVWVNEDLDYYEHIIRGWLLTLIITKKKRLRLPEHNRRSPDELAPVD